MKLIKFSSIVRLLGMMLIFVALCSFYQDPTQPEPIHFTWKLIIALVLGLYDVVVRLIPTINDWSWLSWIVKLLNFLNEFFNRKKKK